MIKTRLLHLPAEIEHVKKMLLTYQEDIETLKESIKRWEIEQLDDIANTVDDNGKPIYSNDAKRKAELERRKASDEQYKALSEALRKAEREMAINSIDLDKLLNEQGNLRAICRLESAAND